MSILFPISLFGALVCIFLWLRDIRIWARTGLSGYRNASIQGIFQTAFATLGVGITYFWSEEASILGAGIVMLALYLQGKGEREKIWTNEPAITRLLGDVPRNTNKKQ